MANYKGSICPVCDKPFAEGDDIVVCPDCGTPYHRACWPAAGCVHADKHGTGYEWKPDVTPDGLPNELVCPNCGTHNPATAVACAHCGIPLPAPDAPVNAAPPKPGPIYNRPNPNTGEGGAGQPFGGTPFGGAGQPNGSQPGNQNGPTGGNTQAADAQAYRVELGPNDTIDGIRAKDWASYLGKSSLYYLLQFFRLEQTKRKIGVSFSAFFLGPIYFFYRKMWKEGAIFSVITLLLATPSVMAMLAVSGSSVMGGMNTALVGKAMWVCSILDCLQMVLRSAFAAYWYKKESGKRIRAICDAIPDEQKRADTLALRGGTSVAAVVLYFAAYLAICGGVVALMGPNISAVMQVLYM
ncbi:MAG: RING finger protein [Gemmiger sp.]|nr:RING finger protein [Gemmiger sp.]